METLPNRSAQSAMGGAATAEEVPPLVRVEHLRKEYITGRGKLVLFEDVSFEVRKGDLMAIVGQSGAGKSTLLHMLGALDTPSSGNVYCASNQLSSLSAKEAAVFRNREIGYVWQFHYLLPEFTALENIAMPLLARGERRQSLSRARRSGCWKWTWETGPAIARGSFPAVNNSGFRWHAHW